MPRVANHDDLEALVDHASDLVVDLRDQRTCGVDGRQALVGCAATDFGRYAVSREDQHGSAGRVAGIFDEDGPLIAQSIDDMAVVDDLVTNVDRGRLLGALPCKRQLDEVDGTILSGAEAAPTATYKSLDPAQTSVLSLAA